MFTVTSTRNNTITKHDGLNWLQAVNAATQFVSAATHDGTTGSLLMIAVQDAAGTGEPVTLPNGTTIEIDLVED